MASQEISESVIHAITPADCQDLYYSGEKNTDMQCFPTLVDNRFYVSLQSLNQGSTSTVVFNPDQGLSDIVLTMTLPPANPTANGPGSYTGFAMPQNWGAMMIATSALRIGGSALYYFNGDQSFVDVLTDCEDSDKKLSVSQLSGGPILTPADYASQSNRTASVYLKMPFNSISALQKTLPCPTDLLTQPVQLLITFNRFSDVAFWYGSNNPNDANNALANLPNAFQSAQVNFKKTTLQNSEHLLARRENMLVSALTYPLRYFSQTSFRTTITQANGQPTQINVSGFRSGSIKYLDVWCRALSGPNGNPVSGTQYNFAPIITARLLINGLVMYDSQLNTAMWSLCDRKTPARFSTVQLAPNGANTGAIATPSSSSWLVIPFAQLCEDVAYKNVVALGYSIQNSIINLQLTLDQDGSYEVNVAPHYSATLMFSKNTAEYVF
jgi:hypothetical protein